MIDMVFVHCDNVFVQTIQEMIQICRHELYPNLDVEVKVQGWALMEAAGYRCVTLCL